MADEPLASRQPSDPLPGWPAAPDDGRGPATAGRPPSAPPPGWAGAKPAWVSTSSAGAPPPPPARSGRSGGDRRGLLVGILVAVLLVAAIAGAVVISQRGDGGAAKKQAAAPPLGAIGGASGPPAPLTPGKEATLLQGRLIVAARPGWEQLESSPDTATVKVYLKEPSGRELLTTLIVTAIPGGGSLDSTLALPGGTGFDAPTAAGPLKATAMPGTSGRVVAGIVRPRGTLFLSLSVFATDGKGVEAPLLRKLFTDQVVPALRFA